MTRDRAASHNTPTDRRFAFSPDGDVDFAGGACAASTEATDGNDRQKRVAALATASPDPSASGSLSL